MIKNKSKQSLKLFEQDWIVKYRYKLRLCYV